VVADLFAIIRLRNEHAAFQGRFELAPSPDTVLDLRWRNGDAAARLHVDVASGEHELEFTGSTKPASFHILQGARKGEP